MKSVFLGGTCAESTWREELIPMLKVSYFNPVVEDWTKECQVEEERQKNHICDIHLYVITSEIKGVFSIAEVIDSAYKERYENGASTIFCYIGDFSEGQKRSLDAVGRMVERIGSRWCSCLEEVAGWCNWLGEENKWQK